MDQTEKPTFLLNPDRFRYQLERYNMSVPEFLSLINEDRTREVYAKEDIDDYLNGKAKVNERFLSRFDKIFESGLTWVISNRPLPDKTKMSIFFRKDIFNSDLNLESRKKIAEYEELKTEISIMSKQLGIKQERKLGSYTVHDDPKIVAGTVRAEFDRITEILMADKEIKKHNDERSYLSNLIAAFEYLNIFVFEFIDRNSFGEKEIKFNGFFTLPNLIAVKRNQKYMKREIFTLAHELGHYLINTEEIDEVIESFSEEKRIEKWCNDYAFHFLLGENIGKYNSLDRASESNNYHRYDIKILSEKTFLSEYAFFTRLRIENRISETDYNYIKGQIEASVAAADAERQSQIDMENETAKLTGVKPFRRGAVPIHSKLFEEIVKLNYFQGNINETQARKFLKVSKDKTLDEVIY
jgi:Zn-dependent peptidase ImmA (M78 family)